MDDEVAVARVGASENPGAVRARHGRPRMCVRCAHSNGGLPNAGYETTPGAPENPLWSLSEFPERTRTGMLVSRSDRRPVMNSSLVTADVTTHLKIITVALLAVVLVMWIAVGTRLTF